MARQVVVAPQAEAQIQTIDAWWRRNRSDAPDLFSSELRDAASRNHVYYLVGTEVVLVLAVWSSVKGSGPDLKPPK